MLYHLCDLYIFEIDKILNHIFLLTVKISWSTCLPLCEKMQYIYQHYSLFNRYLWYVHGNHGSPRVYQIKQETRGLVTYTWYDVTDYEGHTTGSRRHLSPIWLITFMDGQFLGSKNHARLSSCNYLMQWCQGTSGRIYHSLLHSSLLGCCTCLLLPV